MEDNELLHTVNDLLGIWSAPDVPDQDKEVMLKDVQTALDTMRGRYAETKSTKHLPHKYRVELNDLQRAEIEVIAVDSADAEAEIQNRLDSGWEPHSLESDGWLVDQVTDLGMA